MDKVIKKKPFRGLEAQLKQKSAWLAHSFLDSLTEVSLPTLHPPSVLGFSSFSWMHGWLNLPLIQWALCQKISQLKWPRAIAPPTRLKKTTITVRSQHNRKICKIRGKLIQQLREDLIDKVYTRGDGDKERTDHIIRKITLYNDSFLLITLITRREMSGQHQTVLRAIRQWLYTVQNYSNK